MPGGIDYSKWDNFEDSSDDEEESSNDVRVTNLDGPSKVTFGGERGGSLATIVPSSDASSRPTAAPAKSKGERKAAPDGGSYGSWRERGAMASIAPEGSRRRRLFWSQDRHSVVLRLELFREEKANAVELAGAVAYADRFCAVGSSKPTVRATSTRGGTLLEGELPHAVHFAEGEDDVDWLIERSFKDERFLAITLHKAAPIRGVAIWWRRPLACFDEVDVGVRSEQDPQSLQNAWDEAHRLFKERRRPRK